MERFLPKDLIIKRWDWITMPPRPASTKVGIHLSLYKSQPLQ